MQFIGFLVTASGRVIGRVFVVSGGAGIYAFGAVLVLIQLVFFWVGVNAPWIMLIFGILAVRGWIKEGGLFGWLMAIPTGLLFIGIGGFMTLSSISYPGDWEATRIICEGARVFRPGKYTEQAAIHGFQYYRLIQYSDRIQSILGSHSRSEPRVYTRAQIGPDEWIWHTKQELLRVHEVQFKGGMVITCNHVK